jgi:3-phosphoshikimate 1-carboxyvinyltransferase
MNIIKIYHQNKNINGAINITGSKSESNRLLIINALYNNVINIKNISNSEDTNIITHVIKNTNKEHHNIKHAGTAMRFLSAYFAIQKNKNIILTGSQRMKNRPIKILIDALKLLGAKIEYIEHEGFPPIKIYGNNTFNNKVIKMNANTSSQYISALMLIGSKLSKGLHIKLLDNITSKPYINMTFKLLKKIGLPITWNDNDIMINYKETINKQNITVESDWSSASYYYSIAAISDTSHIELQKYNSTSLQGDHIISNIYKKYFGVETELIDNKIILLKKKK